MAAFAPACAAQTRTNHIFHAYVDPIYGDNALASAQNPGAIGQLLPLSQHGDPGNPPLIPRPIQGRLTHAPYSFLTLTGPSGALAWINTAFPGGLPWQMTSGGVDYVVEKVVFHCLPGLCGPRLSGQPIVAPRFGLPWNGEVFPAVIPHGVSIRGTSALDVVFDGRRQPVNVFEAVALRNQLRHEFDFIDRVTIRGAVGYDHNDVVVPQNNVGAGVCIRGPGRSFLTVSNCFITGNTVGIAFDAESGPLEPAAFGHHARVINNTIAWNTIGAWNGNTLWLPSVGIGDSQFLNNIFDTKSPPLPGYEPGVSAFEGVRQAQMFVQERRVPSSLPIPILQNMNAWPIGRGNLGVALVNWVATAPSGASPNTSIWDLSGFLDANNPTPRTAILYVNDALRAATASDYSPHDFRLSPVAWTATFTQMQNPMVNRGIDNLNLPLGSDLVMGTGQPIPGPLGASTGGDWIDPPATVHCWDWDADGYGNPRIAARAGFAGGQFTDIDLGADEMGELIMAGYIDRTRIYSHQVVNAPLIPDHTTVYFLDLPSTTAYARPVFNYFVGGLEVIGGTPIVYYPWWSHAQTPMNAVPGTNYTAGNAAPQSSRNLLVATQGRPAFMRSLMCDVSPHLALDWHPLWADLWDLWSIQRFVDVYACHPWYDGQTVGGTYQGKVDNPFLFYNPPSTGTISVNDWGLSYHKVDVGIASPPGSYPTGGGSYLLAGVPTAVFGPWGPCQSGSPTSTYRVDPSLNPLGILGIGDSLAGCPDVMPWFPGLGSLGIRMNCQRQSGPISNLQTFLVVTTNTVEPEMAARSGPRARGDDSIGRDASVRNTRAVEWVRVRSR